MKKFIALALFKRIAKDAVASAEANFGPGKGIAKKRFAVNFILARLGVPSLIRNMFEDIIIELIDIAVEEACQLLKGLNV